MDELGSLWTYHMSMEDLRHKLQRSAAELESVRREAKEQMRKSDETVKNLVNVVTMANKERDEAREQLQKILSKLNLASTFSLSPESPLMLAAKANSSITESNSPGSSPVSSPEFSNFAADPAEAAMERLARKRQLPEKGRLMQAVMDAGPLLTTLLVAGPLPQWRNPPPPIRIPAVSVKSAEVSSSHLYANNSCSPYSMVSFGGGGGAMGSAFGDGFPFGKRQRLH